MSRPSESASATRTPRTPALRPREVQVLELFAHGHSYLTAAGQLNLSRSTVKDHAINAYRTLGARNAAHAIGIAYRAGILPTEATT